MANEALIRGAQTLAQTQGAVDYTASFPKQFTGADNSVAIARQKEQEAKAQAEQNKVNTYMSQMKSNMDFTGFSAEEQNVIRDFLVSERDRYAFAASKVASIADHTDPEYQFYVDEMNAVNNSFVNLANQMKAYKENKLQHAELSMDGLYSSADADAIEEANAIFSFNRGEDDLKAEFAVLEQGKLGFLVNGKEITFEDYRMPIMRDYKTANSMLQLTQSFYSKGKPLDEYSRNLTRTKVESMLADDNTLRSVLGDFHSIGLDFRDIAWDQNNVAGVRQQVIDRFMVGLDAAADKGKADRDAKSGDGNPADWRPDKHDVRALQLAGEIVKAKGNAYGGSILLTDGHKAKYELSQDEDGVVSGSWIIVNAKGEEVEKHSKLEDAFRKGYSPKK